MNEFNIGKLVRFIIIATVFMSILRACTFSTMGGGYAPMGYGYGGGGGGFFTGMLLGNMMGGGRYQDNRSVRRGSYGRSRGGGFGFGK